MQHKSTDTQLAGGYDPLNLDGFVSPCHPRAVTQVNDTHGFENMRSLSFHLQKMKTSFHRELFCNFNLLPTFSHCMLHFDFNS